MQRVMKMGIAMVMSLTLWLSGMLPWFPTARAWAETTQPPNILVIWGDDIGWENVSSYGMGTMGYTTPNIDRIGYKGNTTFTGLKPLDPANVVIQVDGDEVASTLVERTVPAAFTASETFDVGTDLGSPVSLDYADNAPFPFTGTINTVKVDLPQYAPHFLPLLSPVFD